MHVDRSFTDTYRTLWFPGTQYFSFGRRILRHQGVTTRLWRFDLWGFLFDDFDGLFRGCYAWDPDISPSYPNLFKTAWDNLCVFLTPFFRPRRAFLAEACNRNDTKLIALDRKFLRVRNRKRDCVYVEIRCGWTTAEIRRIRFVGEDGDGVCTFLHGTEGTTREEKVLATGSCLTWKQCDRLLERIRWATPELGWYEPKEERA